MITIGSGHTPRGVCGLKRRLLLLLHCILSHPTRGVWIETSFPRIAIYKPSGHTPRGVCGLKHLFLNRFISAPQSHPTRGVWIETDEDCDDERGYESHPTRGVWIETPWWAYL